MIYLNIFYIFFKVGLFSFGGGYAVLALLQEQIVLKKQWMAFSEFTEIIALSQITPGPISINLATHVGYKIAGFFGSTVATIAVMLPSIIIVVTIIIFLKKFSNLEAVKRTFKALRYGVLGLILGAALSLLVKENFIDYKSYIIFGLTFILGFVYKVSSIKLIVISGFTGFLIYYVF